MCLLKRLGQGMLGTASFNQQPSSVPISCEFKDLFAQAHIQQHNPTSGQPTLTGLTTKFHKTPLAGLQVSWLVVCLFVDKAISFAG